MLATGSGGALSKQDPFGLVWFGTGCCISPLVAKGSSCAPTLRRAACQVGALCLAGDLRLRYGYLPSESNPADAPSRGARPRKRVRRSGGQAPLIRTSLFGKARQRRWSLQARCEGSDPGSDCSSSESLDFLCRRLLEPCGVHWFEDL